jgi:maleylacetate reductase
MQPFTYATTKSRVIFGAGKISEAKAEAEQLGITSALVLSTPEQAADAERLAAQIGPSASVYSGAKMHTPTDVTEHALQHLTKHKIDGLVSIGGGSTIGLGKALALRTDLPQLCIPTTYAGSEMTPILGQTENGVKTTIKTEKVLPETVIYDPDLTMTLPTFIAGPSAMNAIAHSVEALYAQDKNPITSLLAEESIRAIGESLPTLMSDPSNKAARANAFYGSWLAGGCLAAVGMALHHKICHTLGGTFDLNHAAIHCLMIPYSLAYNRDHAPEAIAATSRAFGGKDAVATLFELMKITNKQKSLQDFGLSLKDVDHAIALALKNPYYNPRPVTEEGLRTMLVAAFHGQQP